MRCSLPICWVFGSLALEAACSKEAQPSALSFPAHEPVALAELVSSTRSAHPPQGPSTPYAPRQVKVPKPFGDIPPSISHPILNAQAKAGGDHGFADPVTAFGRCMGLVTGCVQTGEQPGLRDRDSCVASAAVCETNHPWDEEVPCCPRRCQEFYAELRKVNYSVTDAWRLVRDSNCMPGMKELLAADTSK
jgi:hypothetical protein